jgi:hypothetical protein
LPDLWGTWRLEGAWLSDVPRTTNDLEMVTVNGWEGVIGNEFYPGDGNLRVTLQLAGRGVSAAGPFLDQRDAYHALGEIELPFLNARWNIQLEFAAGLDERDVYVHPELAFQGWEPHRIYLGAHFFSGEEQTPGGFHRDHDLVVLGWRGRF